MLESLFLRNNFTFFLQRIKKNEGCYLRKSTEQNPVCQMHTRFTEKTQRFTKKYLHIALCRCLAHWCDFFVVSLQTFSDILIQLKSS